MGVYCTEIISPPLEEVYKGLLEAVPISKTDEFLTQKQIKYAIGQYQKLKRTADIAAELYVTQRRIQQVLAEFRKTGKYHVQGKARRGRVLPTTAETQAVLDAHRQEPVGVIRTIQNRQANHNTSYRRIYKIMESRPGNSKRKKVKKAQVCAL